MWIAILVCEFASCRTWMCIVTRTHTLRMHTHTHSIMIIIIIFTITTMKSGYIDTQLNSRGFSIYLQIEVMQGVIKHCCNAHFL